MPSILKLVAVAMASLTLASAQQYAIDPNSVDKATRTYWCQQQKSACPLLCLQLPGEKAGTRSNTCDPNSLAYSCVCMDGASPNATEFSQTIPYFECQEYGNQCVKNCNGAETCESNCREQNRCGASAPKTVNSTLTTSMTSTAAPSGTGNSAAAVTTTGSAGGASGFGGGDAVTTPANGKKSSAALAMDLGHSLGLGAVIATLFAGFAIVL